MIYTILRIEEDLDFGCEERSADSPVMAVVTLQDDNGQTIHLRQPDQMLYDRNINEGDRVVMNEHDELLKVVPEAEKSIGHFYFVRHGQTVWNVENKICGATDIELTEVGHQQAIETGQKILDEGIQADEILYSPLVRAADTAKHISEMTGIPARVEPRLIEQNFGKWESTPRNGEDFKKAKEDFICSYEGGESMLKLAQRIYNLLDDIKAEAGEKTYILVAHNGISRVIQSYFTDMTNAEYAAFGVKNCEVIRYDFT